LQEDDIEYILHDDDVAYSARKGHLLLEIGLEGGLKGRFINMLYIMISLLAFSSIA